jgi:hypothetical protein
MITRSLTLGCLALLVQAAAGAHAAPLDKASCDKLKTEQGELERAGVRGSLVRGADWAKTNLAADKLEQVRRLIEIDGQVLFRCDGRPLVALPKEVEADPAAVPAAAKSDGPDEEAKPPVKPVPAEAAPAQKKAAVPAVPKAAPAAPAATKTPAGPAPAAAPKPAAPAPKAPAAAPKAAPSSAEAAPKPKPKPKAKADDAYRPQTEPAPNPFANQMPVPAGRN